MSDTISAALIGTVVPFLLAVGAAFVYLFKAAKEAGRAESYRESSTATIKQLGEELHEARLTIASQGRKIDELEDINAMLRIEAKR